jgi:hypothetical protein
MDAHRPWKWIYHTNHPPVFDTAGMDELAGSSQLDGRDIIVGLGNHVHALVGMHMIPTANPALNNK